MGLLAFAVIVSVEKDDNLMVSSYTGLGESMLRVKRRRVEKHREIIGNPEVFGKVASYFGFDVRDVSVSVDMEEVDLLSREASLLGNPHLDVEDIVLHLARL